jgi:hypothetical protein
MSLMCAGSIGANRTTPLLSPTSSSYSFSPSSSCERSDSSWIAPSRFAGSSQNSRTTSATSSFVACQVTPESPTQNAT